MAQTSGGQIVWDLDVDSKGFDEGIASADAKAKTFTAGINSIDFSKLAQEGSRAFNDVADSIGNVLVKTALVSAAGALLTGVFVKSAADLQQTSQSMAVLVGNTAQANALFGQLATYANNTPFTFSQVSKGALTLLGYGITIDKVNGYIHTLGDISAATGADLDSLSLVFGQVNATGKLMGQDALQLINNNVPITTILAKQLGTSVQGVRQAMEDGAISADTFDKALVSVTQQGGFAFQGTDKLAQTFNGRLSTLSDTALEFGRNLIGVHVDPQLGLVVQPGGVFDRLSQLVLQLTIDLPKIQPAVSGAFNFILANGHAILSVVVALAAAFVILRVAAAAVSFAAFVATPFGAVALVVAALVAGITFLQLRFDLLGRTFAALKPLADPLVANFQAIWQILVIGLQPALANLSAAFAILGQTFGPLAPLLELVGRILGTVLVDGLAAAVAGIVVLNVVTANITAASLRFVAGIIQGFVGGAAAVVSAVHTIVVAVASTGTAIFSAGQSIVTGLVNGIASQAGSVVSKIREICVAALNQVKAFFGIHSPSTVMAGVGGYLMQGLAQGIAGSSSLPTTAMSDASSSLLGAVGGLGATSGGSTLQTSSSSVSGAQTSSASGGDVHLTVNLGAYTGSASETRNLGVKIYAELERVARSNGTALPSLGAR